MLHISRQRGLSVCRLSHPYTCLNRSTDLNLFTLAFHQHHLSGLSYRHHLKNKNNLFGFTVFSVILIIVHLLNMLYTVALFHAVFYFLK